MTQRSISDESRPAEEQPGVIDSRAGRAVVRPVLDTAGHDV